MGCRFMCFLCVSSLLLALESSAIKGMTQVVRTYTSL